MNQYQDSDPLLFSVMPEEVLRYQVVVSELRGVLRGISSPRVVRRVQAPVLLYPLGEVVREDVLVDVEPLQVGHRLLAEVDLHLGERLLHNVPEVPDDELVGEGHELMKIVH